MTRDRLLSKVFVTPDGTRLQVVALDSVIGDRVKVEGVGARIWVAGSEFRRLVDRGLLVESDRAA